MFIKVVIVYLIIINIIGYILMGMDKNKARENKWRIKEITLFKVAFAFGSLGIWLGMNNYCHKTKHRKFSKGIPAIFIIQIILIILFLIKFN